MECPDSFGKKEPKVIINQITNYSPELLFVNFMKLKQNIKSLCIAPNQTQQAHVCLSADDLKSKFGGNHNYGFKEYSFEIQLKNSAQNKHTLHLELSNDLGYYNNFSRTLYIIGINGLQANPYWIEGTGACIINFSVGLLQRHLNIDRVSVNCLLYKNYIMADVLLKKLKDATLFGQFPPEILHELGKYTDVAVPITPDDEYQFRVKADSIYNKAVPLHYWTYLKSFFLGAQYY